MRTQPLLSYKDPNDVRPGRFKASLTVADGPVAGLHNPLVLCLLLLFAGNLIYHFSSLPLFSPARPAFHYNTITTSKGETFTTVLSDVSKIWLNLESSIHYPVAFNDEERKVEIAGEAYFEVAHHASKPSTALIKNVDILGTNFNVNTYGNEDVVKATLLEGKVKVTKGNLPQVLSPVTQTNFITNDIEPITILKDADATAICGSHAANDVILITAKKRRSVFRDTARYTNWHKFLIDNTSKYFNRLTYSYIIFLSAVKFDTTKNTNLPQTTTIEPYQKC